MDWWAWFVLGAFLMGTELVVLDVAFYLMFIGIAAVLTGLAVFAGLPAEPWMQWVLFAVLAFTSMMSFRKRLYEKLRGNAPGYDATLTGEYLQLDEDLEPGATCSITYRGSSWTVQNSSSIRIEKGANTQIEGVNGLTLMVGS